MEIKTAKNENESNTLAAARRSERWAIALLAGSALAGAVWFGVPEKVKAQMTPFLAAAGLGVGGAIKLGLVNIKNGRLAVGDLHESVNKIALIPTEEAAMLQRMKPIIEGNLKLEELPAVRSIVEKAVQAVAQQPDMHEGVRRLAEMRRPEGVALPSVPINAARILDPSWEAPV